MLKKNELNIFRYIYLNKKATIKEFSKYFEISPISVRNSLKILNEYFSDNGLGAVLNSNGVYSLDISGNLKNIDWTFSPTSSDRIFYMMLELILKKKLILTEKVSFFEVTRKTINNDLLILKEKMKYFNLNVQSLNGKGIIFSGSEESLFYFVSRLLLKVLLQKEYTQQNTNFFLLNPLFQELYYNFIPKEVEKEIREFVESLIGETDITLNLYYFNFAVACLIFIYLNPGFQLHNNKVTYNVDYSYIDSVFESLDSYKHLSFLKNYKVFLINLVQELSLDTVFLRDNIEPGFFTFIDELETVTKVTFDQKTKSFFYHYWCITTFKTNFDMRRFNLTTNDLPKVFLPLMEKIKEFYNKYLGNIFEEDLVFLTFFVSKLNIFDYTQNTEKKKKILIIDSTLLNFFGLSVKDDLIKNYKVSDIVVKSSSSKLDWDYINKTFDTIFVTDNLYLTEVEKFSSLPSFKIKGIEHLNDSYFFTNFGLSTNF